MSEKLRGEMFWVDRWTFSSGFLLPLEARGLYREMLSQAWIRGAELPLDGDADKGFASFASIRRIVNASDDEWNRCWPLVQANWKQTGSKLRNETQVEIFNESLTLSEKRALAGSRGGRKSRPFGSKPENRGEATPEANPQANPKQRKHQEQEQSLSKSQNPSPSPEETKDLSSATPTPVGKPTPNGDAYSGPFLEFWSAYPRKVGKGAAWSAWKKARRPDVQVLVTAAEDQARSEQWRKDGGQYIPNPATWLNQRRWEDEPQSGHDVMPERTRRTADVLSRWVERKDSADEGE